MDPEPQTFSDVIELWPNAVKFAEEVKVSEIVARQWKRRQSIPAEYWNAIVGLAASKADKGEAKYASVTLSLLAKLAAAAAEARREAAA